MFNTQIFVQDKIFWFSCCITEFWVGRGEVMDGHWLRTDSGQVSTPHTGLEWRSRAQLQSSLNYCFEKVLFFHFFLQVLFKMLQGMRVLVRYFPIVFGLSDCVCPRPWELRCPPVLDRGRCFQSETWILWLVTNQRPGMWPDWMSCLPWQQHPAQPMRPQYSLFSQ